MHEPENPGKAEICAVHLEEKMKYTLLVLMLVALVFVQSCKNDEDDNSSPYHFQNMNEFINFMNQHEWGCYLYIVDNPEDKSQMYAQFEVDLLPDDLTENDTFSLLLNDVEVPMWWDSEYGRLDSDDAALPQANSIKVKFKRNNTVIFDKTIAVPGYPQLAELASFPDFTSALTLSWELNKDSHFQVLSMNVGHIYDYESESFCLSPTARSCVVPANTFTLSNVSAYNAMIHEINIAEHSSCAIATITFDGTGDSIYGKSHSPQRPHTFSRYWTQIR